MEVRLDFQRTEVGAIPHDWRILPITSLLQMGTRITYGVVKPGSDDARGVLFLRGGDILAGKVLDKQLRRIPKAVSDQYARTLLKGGEIVISLVGYPGEVAVVPHRLAGANIARQVALLRVASESLVTRDYLAWYLRSPTGRHALLNEAIGSAQQVINLRDINRVVVPAPRSNAEQKSIAELLSDADALIESLEQLIAKKRQIKQGAMQELLTGKRRLPGFSGEWEVKSLKDICWFQEGPGVRNSQFTTSGIKLLNGTNIFRGILNLESTSRFISEVQARGAYAHFLADTGDIVIASSGITVDKLHEKVAFVRQSDLPFCMNTSTIRFKPNAITLSLLFLFQFLTSDGFKRAIGGQATGSAQLNFGPSHLTRVNISLPTLPEQGAIAEALSD